MTKALKKKPKGAVIQELDALMDQARILQAREIKDHNALAVAFVERLEWMVAVTQLLPQMTRGIQVVADFHRASALGKILVHETFADELAGFRRLLDDQLNCLQPALDKWRKSGTRPLT